jgi:hypothetical protein
MLKLIASLMAAAAAVSAQAKPAFTGIDASGVYACAGDDEHDGQYKSTVTLKRVPEQSFGQYSAYTLTSEAPGLGTYLGYVAVQGRQLSMYFGLTDASAKDFGTGVASLVKGQGGKLSFHLYYYEPEYKGGNHGLEDCVRQ